MAVSRRLVYLIFDRPLDWLTLLGRISSSKTSSCSSYAPPRTDRHRGTATGPRPSVPARDTHSLALEVEAVQHRLRFSPAWSSAPDCKDGPGGARPHRGGGVRRGGGRVGVGAPTATDIPARRAADGGTGAGARGRVRGGPAHRGRARPHRVARARDRTGHRHHRAGVAGQRGLPGRPRTARARPERRGVRRAPARLPGLRRQSRLTDRRRSGRRRPRRPPPPRCRARRAPRTAGAVRREPRRGCRHPPRPRATRRRAGAAQPVHLAWPTSARSTTRSCRSGRCCGTASRSGKPSPR